MNPSATVWARLATRGLTGAIALTMACTSAAPPAPHGSLTLGAPAERESRVFEPPTFAPARTRDLSLVATEVNRHLGDLEACYTARLRDRPALAGTVVMHWNIATDGKVVEQCVTTDTTGDVALLTCVNNFIAARAFPAPRDGAIDVSFPFVFAAS